MQCACAILSSVASPAILHFFKLSGTILEKKFIEHKMYVLVFCTVLPETFLILRTERDTIKNVYWSSCEVPLFLPDFNETSISATDF